MIVRRSFGRSTNRGAVANAFDALVRTSPSGTLRSAPHAEANGCHVMWVPGPWSMTWPETGRIGVAASGAVVRARAFLRIARRHMRWPRTMSLRLGAVRGREPPAAAGVDAARHDGRAGTVDVADEPHGLGFAHLGGDLDRPRATGILNVRSGAGTVLAREQTVGNEEDAGCALHPSPLGVHLRNHPAMTPSAPSLEAHLHSRSEPRLRRCAVGASPVIIGLVPVVWSHRHARCSSTTPVSVDGALRVAERHRQGVRQGHLGGCRGSARVPIGQFHELFHA